MRYEGGGGRLGKNCTATLIFFLCLEDARKTFPFNSQASSFDRSEHDVCYIMIMKSFNWFSICKYVWAVQSCYIALLLALGRDVVFRAVGKVMVSPRRLLCFSLCVQILEKTCFFLPPSIPLPTAPPLQPPVTLPLVSVQAQIWIKFGISERMGSCSKWS